MVADFFGLVGQVIGINPDAVPANQSGAHRHEVPLGARRLQHFGGVDVEQVADHRQFVGERDVEIALGIFHHLGRFRHADRAGPVGARRHHAAIQRIDEIGGSGVRSAGDLEDIGQLAQFIAGVDPFGAVTAEKVAVISQA